jgi:hypothetical protein
MNFTQSTSQLRIISRPALHASLSASSSQSLQNLQLGVSSNLEPTHFHQELQTALIYHPP